MRTAAASQARKTNAARRRFERWEAEMRQWGLEVTWPAVLTLPTEKASPASTRTRP